MRRALQYLYSIPGGFMFYTPFFALRALLLSGSLEDEPLRRFGIFIRVFMSWKFSTWASSVLVHEKWHVWLLFRHPNSRFTRLFPRSQHHAPTPYRRLRASSHKRSRQNVEIRNHDRRGCVRASVRYVCAPRDPTYNLISNCLLD